MNQTVLDVIHRLQLPDNASRQRAEEQLGEVVNSTPSETALALINVAKAADIHISIRQSSLLYLKRIVPVYWSAGFESFKGPAISQDAKTQIRRDLLDLITSAPDSKIRSGGAYAVVQIAAVDYPDEWPDLLQVLYNKMTSFDPIAILGGLSLLQDLFDDLVTEEQFFGSGVGIATITQCMKLMRNGQVGDDIKTAAANLYKACLLQLQNPEVLENPEKSSDLEHHFREIVTLLTVILQDHSSHILSISLRTALYNVAYTLNTEIPERFFEKSAKEALQQEVINDIISTSKVFGELVVLENQDTYTGNDESEVSTSTALNNLLIEQFQFLGSLHRLKLTNTPVEYFLDSILVSSFIPLETESDWLNDYNIFVTDETGVSPDFVPRNAVLDYLSDIDKQDANNVFNWCIKKLFQFDNDDDWRSKEAVLYVIGGLLRHDCTFKTDAPPLVEVLNAVTNLLQDKEILVRARAILLIPDFINKFKKSLSSQDFGTKALIESLRTVSNDESPALKSAFLISLAYYDYFLEFKELPNQSQTALFDICEGLLLSAQEDTLPLLAESLTLSFKITEATDRALNLLLQIASRDPGNIQLVLDIEEGLETLLHEISLQKYLSYAQLCLPGLLATVESSGYDFFAQLSLAIQILNIFIDNCPESFPESLFNILNPVFAKLLLQATDDQLLQLGGEAYNSLITKTEAQLFDVNVVLEILSKFLDPSLSDSAAMNVGSLVISVITKFSDNLKSILPQILEATTKRLIAAKELSTIEDILSVLCYMVSVDVDQTISFLQNLDIQKIFNIWFQNFETLRGKKIKENVHALAQIYLSNKSFNFTVDGDEDFDYDPNVIILRSMKHQRKYKQISVQHKIIKLLIFELNSQSQSRNMVEPGEYAHAHDDEGEEDEEDWEDFEEIQGNFDKLQSYLDDDRHDGDSGEDLRGFLVNFFRSVGSQNDFKGIYTDLTDEERKILAERLL